MTSAGWVRNLWRAWRLQHWDARDSFPARLTRTYASEDERDRDLARLTAHGYRVAVEMDSGETIDVAPQSPSLPRPRAHVPGAVFGGPVTVDLPLAKVTYVRGPAASGDPQP